MVKENKKPVIKNVNISEKKMQELKSKLILSKDITH
jgi:hypothetical protein